MVCYHRSNSAKKRERSFPCGNGQSLAAQSSTIVAPSCALRKSRGMEKGGALGICRSDLATEWQVHWWLPWKSSDHSKKLKPRRAPSGLLTCIYGVQVPYQTSGLCISRFYSNNMVKFIGESAWRRSSPLVVQRYLFLSLGAHAQHASWKGVCSLDVTERHKTHTLVL